MALKKFNPTTPSRRNLVLVDRSDLWKGRPVKKLTEGMAKKAVITKKFLEVKLAEYERLKKEIEELKAQVNG